MEGRRPGYSRGCQGSGNGRFLATCLGEFSNPSRIQGVGWLAGARHTAFTLIAVVDQYRLTVLDAKAVVFFRSECLARASLGIAAQHPFQNRKP